MSGPRFRVGQAVTLLGPPEPTDPYITHFQYRGLVAEVVSGEDGTGYVLELDATMPPNSRFGPFPERRIARGWKANPCR